MRCRDIAFADVFAPTTFTTVVQSPTVTQLGTWDTGLDPHRITHDSEKIEYRGLIVVGEELSTTLALTDVPEGAGSSISPSSRCRSSP
ncbi:FAS1-like dehydratase domain-containing protein [Rhodococcus sp. M8-35]|uniref:FAS1-like dehydratase domain-containing protein n=1 Tax=Rhodococcus sp. M8-35 TaxID=3058401 RepID=UPI002ED4F794